MLPKYGGVFLPEKKAPAGAPEAAKSLENTMKIQKTDPLEIQGNFLAHVRPFSTISAANSRKLRPGVN